MKYIKRQLSRLYHSWLLQGFLILVFIAYVGPALISSKHTELVLVGFALGVMLVAWTVHSFLKDKT